MFSLKLFWRVQWTPDVTKTKIAFDFHWWKLWVKLVSWWKVYERIWTYVRVSSASKHSLTGEIFANKWFSLRCENKSSNGPWGKRSGNDFVKENEESSVARDNSFTVLFCMKGKYFSLSLSLQSTALISQWREISSLCYTFLVHQYYFVNNSST